MPVKEHRTWTRDGGLAGWNYRPMARSDGQLVPLDLEAPDVRKRWIRGLLVQLPRLLGDFAYPTKVDVTAYKLGDDACVVDWKAKDAPPAQLLEFIEQNERLHYVHVDLTLTCQDTDLEPLEIKRGGSLFVTCDLMPSGELNVTEEAPVYLTVWLDVDIYAPFSLGKIRNNTLLAALNGPRLSNFLERIERDMPGELIDIYGDHHPGLVGPRGFKAPGGSPKDA